MSAIPAPTDDELFLFALLIDDTGIDLAEFCWRDESRPDGLFRCWDYQYAWYRDESSHQLDQAGRTTGKTAGIAMRGCAFPFSFPGEEMLITAPELNHLRPIVDELEERLNSVWFLREMRPAGKGGSAGIYRQPHWGVRFLNGAEIRSRLPGKTGKGVKGCVAAGSLILTRRGMVPVEDVVAGDEVLTHENRWRKVLLNDPTPDADVVRVAGGGHRGLVVSDNHKFYARRNVGSRKAKRALDLPRWVTVAEEEITERWYIGSPDRVPPEPVPAHVTEQMMWVVGRYVADGWTQWQTKRGVRTSARIGISVHDKDVAEVEQRLRAAGLKSSRIPGSQPDCWRVETCGTALARWLDEDFGHRADGKRIPVWLLGAPSTYRQAFLEGYLAGDGHWDRSRARWTVGSASKALIVALRLLVQSLGYSATFTWVDPKVSSIRGRALVHPPMRSWRLIFSLHGNAIRDYDANWQKVRNVVPAGEATVYYLVVDEDHSYVSDGLISHNQHPVRIEHDEGQDYPDNGWTELTPCLKLGVPGAQWRVHGVPRGLRDRFYKYSMKLDPRLPWNVHRVMQMYRPTWNDLERDLNEALFGGANHPDYRRNVYGDHGDATNPLFVLARLMACVDQDEGSDYNTDVYRMHRIIDEDVAALRAGYDPDDPARPSIRGLLDQLDMPGNHKDGFSAYYGGGDVGVTNHPSEFLIFGQVKGKETLRLLLRLHLERISIEDQQEILRWLYAHYGSTFKHFGIDRQGVGYGAWQELSNQRPYSKWIIGFDFGAKEVVDFEDRDLERDETLEDVAMERNFLDYASDELRKWVDARKIELPYDIDMLTEWQGQTTAPDTGAQDPSQPKRRYSKGKFHSLDAGKYMIGARTLPPLQAMIEASKNRQEPVLDRFPGAMAV